MFARRLTTGNTPSAAGYRPCLETLEPRKMLDAATPVPTPLSAADLVIDPSIAWGAYIGGDDSENGNAVAMDAYKCVYAAGYTDGAGWIAGGFDTTYGGNFDAYVIKYTRKGTRLWSTYLGGSNYDVAYGITVSNAGRVYVVGRTDSAGWTSGGVGDHSYNSGGDAFVAKLRRSGGHHWSRYLGGGAYEEATGVACSANEAVHISGMTNSAGWITKGPDTTYGGNSDGFYARVWVNGLMLRGSYIGGSNSDHARAIAVDGRSDVLVAGETYSSGWAKKGKDTTLGGAQDGFLTKFAAGGKHIWSRYLGASSDDAAYGVTIGAYNKIYVCGWTKSTGLTANGWDTTYGADWDGFIFAMKTTGQHIWSSYLGGDNADFAFGITADSTGDVYVVGHSHTAGWVVGGWDTTHNGGTDGFVVRFTAGGGLYWSSYIGGGHADTAKAVTPDTFNGVHIVGNAASAGWLTGGFDDIRNGTDAFTFWAKR